MRLNLLDVPGHRSSHKKPTPTMGGLAIVIAFFLGILIARLAPAQWEMPQWFGWFVAGAALVALVGLIDDLKGLPILLRLFLYLVAAGFMIAGGIHLRAIDISPLGRINLGVFGIPITVFWVIAIVSFYNFMDGIDGLAAGVGVIVAGFLAYIAWSLGNSDILVLGLLLGGSCVGFLWHNFPPAKIFMGDVGSTFIGYVLAVLALIGNQSGGSGYIPLFVSVLLLGAFLFDTIVTLGRRMMKREKWYLSHREHYYQKMTNLGLSHRQVSLGEYGVTFLLGFSALLYLQTDQTLGLPILFGWLIILTGLTMLIGMLEKRKAKEGETSD